MLKLIVMAVNMVPARLIIHTSCLASFNFEVFLVWLICCDIRALVIANIIIVIDVASDLKMAGDGILLAAKTTIMTNHCNMT